MSEELLSALLDGECTPGEVKRLLAQLEDAPALQQHWTRMCLVREASESTRVRKASVDFCAGVMAAIERDLVAAPVQPQKVVPLSSRRPAVAAPVRVSRWQPFAGLAAAASIAAIATVGGYRLVSQPVGAPAAVASAGAQAASDVASVQPADFVPAAPQAKLMQVSATSAKDEPVETRWSQLDADTARQLNEYMMEHSNMRAEQGVGGALSYPRMMLRTAEYRPGEPH
jgi:negative regulator of sigma E activity